MSYIIARDSKDESFEMENDLKNPSAWGEHNRRKDSNLIRLETGQSFDHINEFPESNQPKQSLNFSVMTDSPKAETSFDKAKTNDLRLSVSKITQQTDCLATEVYTDRSESRVTTLQRQIDSAKEKIIESQNLIVDRDLRNLELKIKINTLKQAHKTQENIEGLCRCIIC